MTRLADAVLEGRNTTEEDRFRTRLVTGASRAVAAAAGVLIVLVITLGWDKRFLVTAGGLGAILLADTYILRRTGRLKLAGTILCLTLLAGVLAACALGGGLTHPALSWTVLVALLAPMLLPRRLVIACLAFVVAGLTSLCVVELAGHRFPALPAGPGMQLSGDLLLNLLVAALAWIYERARRDALAQRDTALDALEASREARVALVENVQAVIFSVDRDLRLIAGNSWFDRLSHEKGRPPIRPGEPVLDGLAEAQHADLQALFDRALAGERFSVERTLQLRSRTFECEILFNPIRRATGEVRGVTAFGRDISERNRNKAELEKVNRELAEVAHLAGKAEVATDVLHSVGNVLAALNSSADLVLERLRSSRAPFLGKTVALLQSAPDLGRFLSKDERGKQIPAYLALLADTLERERVETIAEMNGVHRQLDHVKAVIARQQAHARTGSTVEVVSIADVIADALAIHAASFERHGIAVTTDVAPLPLLSLDRHKLVEILTNFVVNARQAIDASDARDRQLVVRAFRNEHGRLQIDVIDSGIGMSREQQARLFSYGFTTKVDGHGFGLASSLMIARTLGGDARGRSDGPGTGATFTVELPLTAASTISPTERAA